MTLGRIIELDYATLIKTVAAKLPPECRHSRLDDFEYAFKFVNQRLDLGVIVSAGHGSYRAYCQGQVFVSERLLESFWRAVLFGLEETQSGQ